MKDELTLEIKLKILQEIEQPMQFTLEELAQFDGKEGRPAYVAVDEIVYDVTSSPSWVFGEHFGINAGKDVSVEFRYCHAPFAIEKILKVVGELIK